MTVYLDVIFLENILMNYIILAATVVITKNQTKHNQLRLIFASIIGSTYAILLYLKVFKIYETFFAKIILSVIIVFVALNPKSIKELVKRILTFYLVSFVFGGCTVALMYLINPNKIILKNGGILVKNVEKFDVITEDKLNNVNENFSQNIDSKIQSVCIEVTFKKYKKDITKQIYVTLGDDKI